jgi:hypothetical protein
MKAWAAVADEVQSIIKRAQEAVLRKMLEYDHTHFEPAHVGARGKFIDAIAEELGIDLDGDGNAQ